MKKVLALVICIAMIACFAVTASAETYDVTLTVGSVEGAKVGDVVEVAINVSEASDLGALSFDILVDADYLAPEAKQDKRGNDYYFEKGSATEAAGALIDGNVNDGIYTIAAISTDGYYDAGAVATIFVKVIAELPEEGAVITLANVAPTHYEDATANDYNITVVDGTVKGEAVKEPVVTPPTVEPPVETKTDVNGTTTDTDVTDTDATTDIPKTGETTAIAVAAGLCAVMAAAFVITKKVND